MRHPIQNKKDYCGIEIYNRRFESCQNNVGRASRSAMEDEEEMEETS